MFYIYAQRNIGAARTSTYYAVAPFVSSTISLIVLKEKKLEEKMKKDISFDKRTSKYQNTYR